MANGVPKQVEEADRMAREYVASLNGEEAEATDDETTEEEEKTDDEEEESESEEEESESTESEEEEETEESEETDSEEEEEEASAGDDDSTWEQRYKTLKGMFEAETKKYNDELKEWKQQVFDRLGQPAPAAEAVTEEPETPEEVAAFIEEMGPEYIEKLNKYMEFMLKPMVDSSVKPVAEKVDDVEDATLRAAQKQFSDYLDTKVNGDWQTLMEGSDEDFVAFLNAPDPSGLYTNGQLMKLYNDNWDADRLATLLNSYIGEPEPEEKPKPKPKKPANVQPKRKTPNSQPEEEGEAKIWTQADIKELEKAERDGKLTPEESKAQFADLLAAANEGRIRG